MSRPGAPAGTGGDSAEFDSLLARLGGEICRPLELLQGEIGRLLADPSNPVSDAERDQVRVMLGLCEDLGRLTRDCLGDVEP